MEKSCVPKADFVYEDIVELHIIMDSRNFIVAVLGFSQGGWSCQVDGWRYRNFTRTKTMFIAHLKACTEFDTAFLTRLHMLGPMWTNQNAPNSPRTVTVKTE